MSYIVAKEQARIAGVIADYMTKRVFIEDYRLGWTGTIQQRRAVWRAQKLSEYTAMVSLRKMASHIAKRELKIPFVHGTITMNTAEEKAVDRYPVLRLQVPKKPVLAPLHTFLGLGASPSAYYYSLPRPIRKDARFEKHAKTVSYYWLTGDAQIDGFWQFMQNPQVKEIFKL